MKVIASLRDNVGSEIPLRILFEYPTPEGLASQITNNTSWPYNPLLPLQTKGTKPPIFCVHPGGGFGTVYQNLSRALGLDQPVWAFQARGIGQEEALHESMDHMVEEYIAAMRSVQPKGPYRLLGWSLGGAVAHQIAVQLEDSGNVVETLILMDAEVSEGLDPFAGQSYQVILREQLGDFAVMLDIDEDDISLNNEAFLQRLIQKMSLANMIPPYTDRDAFLRVLDVYLHNIEIMENSTNKICNAPILFMRATQEPDNQNDITMAWANHTRGSVDVVDIDTDHMGMWTEPVSQILAQKINEKFMKS